MKTERFKVFSKTKDVDDKNGVWWTRFRQEWRLVERFEAFPVNQDREAKTIRVSFNQDHNQDQSRVSV